MRMLSPLSMMNLRVSQMQIAIGGGGRHACGTQSSHSEP
jgi:hypothetical protein